MSSSAALLSVECLRKTYAATPVFDHVSLEIRAGEFVALIGESGVGKSTLLNCIAGLDDADSGHVRLAPRDADVHDVTSMTDDGRALMRRRHLGFVFQAFHVLPHLNVAENVELPLRLLGTPVRRWAVPKADQPPGTRSGPYTAVGAGSGASLGAANRARVAELLDAVGLAGLGTRLPAQLSGGQLQRVAIARALAHRPALLLADEPTGNLDPATAERVLDLLLAQTRAHGAACLLVTHSQAAARRADRVLVLTGQGIVAAGVDAGAAAVVAAAAVNDAGAAVNDAAAAVSDAGAAAGDTLAR
jgi:putative ABC transport system ATP-binding protein